MRAWRRERGRGIEPGDGVRVTSEDILAEAEGNLPASPRHSVGHFLGIRRRAPRTHRLGGSAERVAEAVDGPDVARLADVVAERAPQLGHESRQARLRHVGLAPDLLFKVLLGHCLRPALRQEEEQIEGLRREMYGLVLAEIADGVACRERIRRIGSPSAVR
jgi:hypothetical protein